MTLPEHYAAIKTSANATLEQMDKTGHIISLARAAYPTQMPATIKTLMLDSMVRLDAAESVLMSLLKALP